MKNLKGYWDELHRELKINNDMIVMKAEYEGVASNIIENIVNDKSTYTKNEVFHKGFL